MGASMCSIYDLILWAYYAAHGRTPPDPARHVLARSGWLPASATVLDYGGGDGRWAVTLAEQAALVVVAEVDERVLRKVPAHPRMRPVLLDGMTLPFRTGAFDLVFVNHVLHHVEGLPNLLGELRRVLRPRGRLVVIELDPRASVTHLYRMLSRLRAHPCTFYPPRTLAHLLGGQGLTAEEQRLDGLQYVVVASQTGDDRQSSNAPAVTRPR
jgi:SAM-dependent methyltransferase